jgi:hypothetical protein
MKYKYNKVIPYEQLFDKDFMTSSKEMILRSPNQYTETITMSNTLQADIEIDLQILNTTGQEKTKIASKS